MNEKEVRFDNSVGQRDRMRFSHNIDWARPIGHARIVALLSALYLVPAANLAGQTPQRTGTPDALHQLNDSIEALVRHVSPSVVQIVVTGYGSTKESDRAQADLVVGRQRVIGSGVIVDPDGYIVTNAHVVKGAQQIEVVVPAAGAAGPAAGDVDPSGRS
jgi:S1-C subfamily serine protease